MRKLLIVLTIALSGVGALVPAGTAGATETAPHKVFVCKYVGKPFVDERLQTGQNPIDVDVAAIPEDPVQVGSYFADQQGRSYVLAFDTGQEDPDVSECPPPAGPETTTTTQPEGETTTTTEGETTTTVETGPGITVHGSTGSTGTPVTDLDQTTAFAAPTGSSELPRTGTSAQTLFGIGGILLLVGLALTLRRPNQS